MNNTLLSPLMILAGLLGVTGCALDGGGPLDTGDPMESAAGENVATAEQPLLGSAHAQAFGLDFNTPDLGNGLNMFGATVATGDLNGDGATDMVVGIPQAANGATPHTGAVDIFWGKKAQGAAFGGLSNGTMTQLHQPGAGNPETGDLFGLSVAIGDFNCDGHLDLAVGAPWDSLSVQGGGSISNAGNVSIFYGPDFTSPGWQLFWQGSAGIPGVAEAGDFFGGVLTAGNFNGDTSNGHACDDLAIGSPSEGIGSAAEAGSVTVLYGRSTGLNTSGAPSPQLWHQNVGSVFGVAEAGDNFGAALVAGDFNHDGKDDLAIGVPHEGYESVGKTDVGLVQVLMGASGGLTDTGSYALELSNFAGMSPRDASMGSSLARGDFDGDGDDDLAVGTPHLSVGGAYHAGGVLIYRQTNGVLTAALQYDQNSPNVPDTAEAYDSCGNSLAAGDFNGDGKDDLANGCQLEGVTGPYQFEGAISIAYFGAVSGSFGVANGQLWDLDSAGVPGQCTLDDNFSYALSAGDFNGDGKTDVSSSGFSGGAVSHGFVNVFYGAP